MKWFTVICLLTHDNIIEYVPLTKEVKKYIQYNFLIKYDFHYNNFFFFSLTPIYLLKKLYNPEKLRNLVCKNYWYTMIFDTTTTIFDNNNDGEKINTHFVKIVNHYVKTIF